MHRAEFTLIELLVVIAIMTIPTGSKMSFFMAFYGILATNEAI